MATEADLERDGFGPTPLFLSDRGARGMSGRLCPVFFNYSTWLGRPGSTWRICLLSRSCAAWVSARRCSSKWRLSRWKKAADASNGRFWTGIRRPLISICGGG